MAEVTRPLPMTVTEPAPRVTVPPNAARALRMAPSASNGAVWPGHGDPPADRDGGGEEHRCIDEIRFDDLVACADRARTHPPGVRSDLVVDATVSQHGQGQPDVRARRDGRAVVMQFEPLGELRSGEEEP